MNSVEDGAGEWKDLEDDVDPKSTMNPITYTYNNQLNCTLRSNDEVYSRYLGIIINDICVYANTNNCPWISWDVFIPQEKEKAPGKQFLRCLFKL